MRGPWRALRRCTSGQRSLGRRPHCPWLGLEWGAGYGGAFRIRPPSRNSETQLCSPRAGRGSCPSIGWEREGKGHLGHLPAPNSEQATGTCATAADSNSPHTPTGLSQATVPCSFDLGLGRVRFPFCNFLKASLVSGFLILCSAVSVVAPEAALLRPISAAAGIRRHCGGARASLRLPVLCLL